MDTPSLPHRPDLPEAPDLPDHRDVPAWAADTMRTVAEADSLGAAACHYAALGIPVFPCVPGAKHPLTRSGFHDATTSRQAVHDWWRRHPRANIGVPTGVVSGFAVVDVDVHAGANGFPAFENARDAGLATTWNWLVRTPSGGLHAYFPTTTPPQPCWQSPGAHIDFRGDGGYIVAPPSVIEVNGSPTSYVVIATANHAAAPLDATQLRSHLDPSWNRHDPPLRQPAPRPFGSRADTTARPERLAAWVAALPEGGRNGGLFWAACRMAEGGHRFEATLASIGAGARDAGLEEREVRATVASAYRTTSRSTRTAAAAPSGSSSTFTTTHQRRGIAP